MYFYFTFYPEIKLFAGPVLINTMDTLNSEQRSLAWGVGAVDREQLSKQATTPALIRLYHLLLFTLPGTPVFTYGDEIGLQSGQARQRESHRNNLIMFTCVS